MFDALSEFAINHLSCLCVNYMMVVLHDLEKICLSHSGNATDLTPPNDRNWDAESVGTVPDPFLRSVNEAWSAALP
jgi:hypothetical protein